MHNVRSNATFPNLSHDFGISGYKEGRMIVTAGQLGQRNISLKLSNYRGIALRVTAP